MQRRRAIKKSSCDVEEDSNEPTGRTGTEEVDRVKGKQEEVKEEIEEAKGWEGEMHRDDAEEEDVKDGQLRLRKPDEGGKQAGKTHESRKLKIKSRCDGLLSLLLVLSRLGLGLGKHIEGTLRTTENWALVTRFCFQPKGGNLSFDVEYDIDFSGQRLFLYYSMPDQWPAIYGTNKTCLEKEAGVGPQNNQVIDLSGDSPECTVTQSPGEEEGEEEEGARAKIQCHGNRTFVAHKEHWWFVVVSNCESDQGLRLRYRFTMTNGEDFWYKHFSADQFHMQTLNLTALGFHLVLFSLSFVVAAKLRNQECFRTTYLLFMCATGLQLCCLILSCLHYVRYAINGVGFPNSLLAGRVLSGSSFVVMVLLLFLTGMGFNVTRCRLQRTLALLLAAFMSLFAFLYALLFILEVSLFDPGLYLYTYESPVGYCRMALHLVALVLFLGACLCTLGYSTLMTTFFLPFFIFYTLWFVALPVSILTINLASNKLIREEVATGVELLVTFLGHAFFLALTVPIAANKTFPYRPKKIHLGQTSGVVGNNAEMHEVTSISNSITNQPGKEQSKTDAPAKTPPTEGKESKAKT